MSLFLILILAVGVLAVSSLTTPLVRRWALTIGCVSRPTHDRWGRRVVPRMGGIPIAAAFLAAAAWGVSQDPRFIGLLGAGILMFAVGLIDDIRRLHPNAKLTAQIIAGCLVVLSGIRSAMPTPWLEIPVTILWLVLMMNAFNLMDNMDGLAGGIGAIAGGFCIWNALQTGQGVLAVMATALTAATLGFLRYNLPPAKIFMGDTGSQVLGLALGTLTLLQSWHQSANLIGILAIPTLLLAVPIFDTCFVTLERLMNGRHPFQGGTDHTSHRLSVLGLTPRQVLFTLYTFSVSFGMLSVVLTTQRPSAVLGISLFALGTLLLFGAYLAKVRVYSGPTVPLHAQKVTVIETMLTHKRRVLEAIVDFVFICTSYILAHALRFEGDLTPELQLLIVKSLPWIIVIKMLAFSLSGVYRGVWRYIGLPDMVNIFRSTVLGSVGSALLVLYFWRFEGYSRSVFIIDGLLLFLLIGGSRMMEPLLNEWITALRKDGTPVLIVGAGDTGELLLQQLKLDLEVKRRVVGFLDDDPAKIGGRIHGVPILGARGDLGSIVQNSGVRELFIAMRRPPPDLLQQIQGYCEENGISWRIASHVMSQDKPSPTA